MSLSQTELINKLKTKFYDLDVNFDKFSEILIRNNAFISGSFLLQVIQNRYYGDSDIDIFTFGQQNEEFDKEIHTFLMDTIVNKIRLNKLNIFKENNYYYEKNTEHKYYRTDDPENTKFLETKDLKYWIKSKNKGDTSNKTEAKIKLYNVVSPVKIYNHYKNINAVSKHGMVIRSDYSFDKINAIVNFESDNVLSKYQIVYYDDTIYKTPLDIINDFDLDFCKNYFDGNIFYVENYDSIITSSCILNLIKPRIYKNQKKRIIKYIKRNFNIKVKYNEDLYDIIYLNYTDHVNNTINFSKELNEDIINLIFVCDNAQFEMTKILENLPVNLEKLIIYTYNSANIIDNLPTNLQELRLYIWKACTGMEDGSFKNDIVDSANYMKYEEYFNKILDIAKSNIKRVPFGCNVFINDVIYEK